MAVLKIHKTVEVELEKICYLKITKICLFYNKTGFDLQPNR